jgi:hypothetical protein
MMHIVAPLYQTRGNDFFRVRFHRMNYGAHEPINGELWKFIEVIGLFDFHLTKKQFVNRVKLAL